MFHGNLLWHRMLPAKYIGYTLSFEGRICCKLLAWMLIVNGFGMPVWSSTMDVSGLFKIQFCDVSPMAPISRYLFLRLRTWLATRLTLFELLEMPLMPLIFLWLGTSLLTFCLLKLQVLSANPQLLTCQMDLVPAPARMVKIKSSTTFRFLIAPVDPVGHLLLLLTGRRHGFLNLLP